MTERRCPSCHSWYEKSLGACPECEEPPASFNSWLYTSKLNSHLYQQAQDANPRVQFQKLRSHYNRELAKGES